MTEPITGGIDNDKPSGGESDKEWSGPAIGGMVHGVVGDMFDRIGTG